MSRGRWIVLGLVIMGVAGFGSATAVAQTNDGAVTDPMGDCLPSPCADLVAASVTSHPYGPLFRVDAAGQWFAPSAPLPAPQISIWTNSPDTGPPDAVIGVGGARVANLSEPILFQVDYSNPFLPSDYVGGPASSLEIAVGGDEVPGFWALVGSRFRWRVSLPADQTRIWDEQRPVDPFPADAAPDRGAVAFSAVDRDGDGLPDIADPCPDGPFSAAAPGWFLARPKDGCPAPVAPFSHPAFVAAAKRAAKAFRTLWRTPRERSLALKRRRIDLPLRLPQGVGHIKVSVTPHPLTGPTRASVYGGRDCRTRRCTVRLKVAPKGVRAYAGRRLQLAFNITVRSGDESLSTSYVALLRMPLAR